MLEKIDVGKYREEQIRKVVLKGLKIYEQKKEPLNRNRFRSGESWLDAIILGTTLDSGLIALSFAWQQGFFDTVVK